MIVIDRYDWYYILLQGVLSVHELNNYSDVDLRESCMSDVELLLFYCRNRYKQYFIIAELA